MPRLPKPVHKSASHKTANKRLPVSFGLTFIGRPKKSKAGCKENIYLKILLVPNWEMGTLGAINRSINHQAIRSFVLKPARPPSRPSVSPPVRQSVYLGVSFRVGERVFTIKGQFTVCLSVSQSLPMAKHFLPTFIYLCLSWFRFTRIQRQHNQRLLRLCFFWLLGAAGDNGGTKPCEEINQTLNS